MWLDGNKRGKVVRNEGIVRLLPEGHIGNFKDGYKYSWMGKTRLGLSTLTNCQSSDTLLE